MITQPACKIKTIQHTHTHKYNKHCSLKGKQPFTDLSTADSNDDNNDSNEIMIVLILRVW